MKLAIVSNQSKSTYNFRKDLIFFFLKKHKVSVIATEDDSSPKFIDMGCNFIPVDINPRSLNIFLDIKFICQLLHRLRILRPDLVISYTVKPNIYSPLVCRALGIKCLPVITGLGNSFLYSAILRNLMVLLYRFSLSKLPEIWFLNQNDLDFFISRGICKPDQAKNIHGEGIDLDHFKPKHASHSSSEFCFLYFGRILIDKGINELLDAFLKIKEVYPYSILTLVGDFDLTNKKNILIKARVLQMSVNGTINYLPSVSDVRDIIAESNCVLLPSYREGLSRALMEAASMAKPIIASNVPGCSELVIHNKSGILINEISSKCIYDAMAVILATERARLIEMGRNGRRHMELTCSINNTCNIYNTYIERLKLNS